jgi:hypothetical protein
VPIFEGAKTDNSYRGLARASISGGATTFWVAQAICLCQFLKELSLNSHGMHYEKESRKYSGVIQPNRCPVTPLDSALAKVYENKRV